MSLIAALKTFIYLLSSSLFYPVLGLLSLLSLWIVMYTGSFFAEWIGRRRIKPCPPLELAERLRNNVAAPWLSPPVRSYVQELDELLKRGGVSEVELENLLQHAEFKLWKSIDKLKILIRTGPGLGLIGTLVPMGTGLAALGQGDMTRLSSDLVVAFTTTVVGLAIGMLAYFFFTIKRQWIEEDIRHMELATEILALKLSGLGDDR